MSGIIFVQSGYFYFILSFSHFIALHTLVCKLLHKNKDFFLYYSRHWFSYKTVLNLVITKRKFNKIFSVVSQMKWNIFTSKKFCLQHSKSQNEREICNKLRYIHSKCKVYIKRQQFHCKITRKRKELFLLYTWNCILDSFITISLTITNMTIYY